MRWIAGDLHQRLKIWTAYFAIKDTDLPVKNGLQSRPWDSKWIHIMFSDASQSVCLFSDLKKKKTRSVYDVFWSWQTSIISNEASCASVLWLKYWHPTNLGIQDYMWDWTLAGLWCGF